MTTLTPVANLTQHCHHLEVRKMSTVVSHHVVTVPALVKRGILEFILWPKTLHSKHRAPLLHLRTRSRPRPRFEPMSLQVVSQHVRLLGHLCLYIIIQEILFCMVLFLPYWSNHDSLSSAEMLLDLNRIPQC